MNCPVCNADITHLKTVIHEIEVDKTEMIFKKCITYTIWICLLIMGGCSIVNGVDMVQSYKLCGFSSCVERPRNNNINLKVENNE